MINFDTFKGKKKKLLKTDECKPMNKFSSNISVKIQERKAIYSIYQDYLETILGNTNVLECIIVNIYKVFR